MGLIDNSLMLICGSELDSRLGFYLGLSALGAAAAGNSELGPAITILEDYRV